MGSMSPVLVKVYPKLVETRPRYSIPEWWVVVVHSEGPRGGTQQKHGTIPWRYP